MTDRPLSFADDVLATPEQAAQLLQVSVATLQKWRSTGEHNIPFVKIGRSARYRVLDLRAYIDRHTKQAFEISARG